MRFCRRATLFLVTAASGTVAHASEMQQGVISYWGPTASLYDVIPSGSVAVINPDNGALISEKQSLEPVKNLAAFAAIAKAASERGVRMLGYVPTGYFAHDCDAIGKCQTWGRIEAQVKSYFQSVPDIAGIFFDETSPFTWDCGAFGEEYERLRQIVQRHRPGATIAFNAGVPDNCVVAATRSGEIAVLFENSAAEYAAQAENVKWSAVAAREKGVKIWHLVHSVRSQQAARDAIAKARLHGADYFYATSIGGNWQAGENTWGNWSRLDLEQNSIDVDGQAGR